jgi:uncharacterized protein YdeI (BOF family)
MKIPGNIRASRLLITTLFSAFTGLLLVGCASRSDHVLGVAPAGEKTSSVQSLASYAADSRVTLQGEMIEKCPVAGCWFMLKDKTGVVRVDTKAAGFVVSDVPLHTTLTVCGTVTTGTERGIAAAGVRY